MNITQRIQLSCLVVLALCSSNAAELYARNYALVIGVSEYASESVDPLPLVYQDADCISKTLENGLYSVTRIYARASEQPNTEKPLKVKDYWGKMVQNFVPTKANIEKLVNNILLHTASDDHIIVYFSGHGTASLKDKNRTLLTSCDSILGDESTFIQAQWLRNKLMECPAQDKVLLIDSCHAGGTKGITNYVQKVNPMSDAIDGVVTIASCTKEQVSGFWDVKQLSLFTYWLNQGLKGFADSNFDGQVKSTELFEYIQSNMRITSKSLKKDQEPVLLCPATLKNIPTVIEPLPRYLDDVLDDFADQISSCLMTRNIPKTGVLPFSFFERDALGDIIKANKQTSDLPSYCANELERRVKYKLDNVGSNIRVVDSKLISEALKKNYGQDDQALSKIEVNGYPVESHIRNSITKIQKTINTSAGPVSGEFYELQSRLILSESLNTPLMVKSVVSRSDIGETLDKLRKPPYPSEPEEPTADPERIAEAEMSAVEQNLWLEVINDKEGKYEKRHFTTIGDEEYITLKSGDIYRIVISTMGSEAPIGARILVDGMNTLPQPQNYISDKFVIAGAAPDNANYPQPSRPEPTANPGPGTVQASDDPSPVVFMPHVRLDDANFWIMDPNNTYSFAGFYRDDYQNFGPFVVTDAPDALAEMSPYSDQIGLITIGLYSLVKGRSGEVTTRPGPDQHRPIFVENGYKLGEILRVIHIRYTSEASVQNAGANAVAQDSIIVKSKVRKMSTKGSSKPVLKKKPEPLKTRSAQSASGPVIGTKPPQATTLKPVRGKRRSSIAKEG